MYAPHSGTTESILAPPLGRPRSMAEAVQLREHEARMSRAVSLEDLPDEEVSDKERRLEQMRVAAKRYRQRHQKQVAAAQLKRRRALRDLPGPEEDA